MKQLAPGLRQFGTDPPDGSCGAMYLVGDGDDVALIDSGTASNFPLVAAELHAAGLRPQDIAAVYITHGHSDHYEGAAALRRYSDAVVYLGSADQRAVAAGDYWGTAGFYYGRHSRPLADTEIIGNGYEQRFGGCKIRAIETPGHTPGSVSYEVELLGPRLKVGILGDTAWGGWHERIGSDLTVWKESISILRRRRLSHVTFGHCVNTLVEAGPHLELLEAQIGTYCNAYDQIPEEYFDESQALPAYEEAA